MKNIKFFPLLIGIVLVLTDCNNVSQKESLDQKTDPQIETSEKFIENTETNNVIFLDGLYATSVKLPNNQYSSENMFDNNKNYWATMQGAGPDEGIMIIFMEETYISKCRIRQHKNNGFAKIKNVKIYVNGILKFFHDIDKEIDISDDVKSLFIRINNVEGIEKQEGEMSDGGYIYLEKFDNSLSIGIDELKFLDENGNTMNICPPVKIKGEVIASSTLEPEAAYNTDLLFDSRKEFGWAEGSKGNGTGENLTFKFNQQVTIKKIRIWNGYQRSDKHFNANARVKIFSFGLNNKDLMSQYTLDDIQQPITITLQDPLSSKNFIFLINEVYKGISYKDLVISEMRFFDGEKWFVAQTGRNEKVKQELKKQINNTVLAGIVDRRMFQFTETDFVTETSIILRSNMSFVIYSRSFEIPDEDIVEQTIADGNWEIKSLSTKEAKIRIFGKLRNISTEYQPYKGAKKSEQIKIFHDNLLIKPGIITGEKVFESIVTQL